MYRIAALVTAVVLFGAAMLFAIPAVAQVRETSVAGQAASAKDDAMPALRLAEVEAALATIEADAGIEDAVKDLLRPKYKQAIDTLKEAADFAAKAAAYRGAIQTAPQSAAEAKAELQALPSADNAAELPAIDNVEDLQRDIDARRAALNALSENLSKTSAELTGLKTRPVEISARLPEARRELSEVARKLASVELAGDQPAQVADRFVLQGTRSKVLGELDVLQQDQLSLSVREDLLRAQQALLTRQVENATAALNAREASLHGHLTSKAKRFTTLAETLSKEVPQGNATTRSLAVEVQRLAEQFQQVVKDAKMVSAARDFVTAEYLELARDYESTRNQLKLGGGGGAVAQILFNLEHQARSTETKISVRQVPDFGQTRLAAIQTEAKLNEQPKKESQFANAASQLVATRGEVLQELQKQYGQLSDNLAAFEADKTRCLNLCDEIHTTVGEQLFWMRTSPPINMETLTDIPGSLRWSFNREHRQDLREAVQGMFTRVPLHSMAVALLLAVLLLMRHRIGAALIQTGMALRRISTDRYATTGRALFYTLLLAIPIPLLMGYAAWVLAQYPSRWLQDIAYRLEISAWLALFATTMAAICRPGGLGEAHLGWRIETLDQFRRALNRVVVVYIPALLMANSHYMYEEAAAHFNSVGRICFILSHVWVTLVLWQLFRSSDGILATLTREQPTHVTTRSRHLWFPMVLACPIGLIVLAWQGYLITAVALSLGLLVTVALIAGGAVSYGLVLRWFTMNHRKFALQEAIEKRRALREAAASEDDEETTGEIVTVDPHDEEGLDLDAISEQTQALLRLMFGLGTAAVIIVFWSGTFPLGEFFGAIPIPLIQGLTLLNVVQALVVLVVTWIAAQNLPGLLELAVLRAKELDSGTRHAISTLCQYAVIAIGLAVLFNVVHIDWSKFGWMAAALSVGLGFGLQEVVANFVCGLILLFERPIRIGDIITIEGTTGTVTRINMRATTITNWDREELVVPNKTFITSTVLNLTLSSPLNRILVPVGIAYGSDTEKARQILLDAAADHPRLLDDPPPMASFDQFADSSLNLMLRAFLPDRENRLGTITELHTEIANRFATAGIEIAFPQQDLHLRSGWDDTRQVEAGGAEAEEEKK